MSQNHQSFINKYQDKVQKDIASDKLFKILQEKNHSNNLIIKRYIKKIQRKMQHQIFQKLDSVQRKLLEEKKSQKHLMLLEKMENIPKIKLQKLKTEVTSIKKDKLDQENMNDLKKFVHKKILLRQKKLNCLSVIKLAEVKLHYQPYKLEEERQFLKETFDQKNQTKNRFSPKVLSTNKTEIYKNKRRSTQIAEIQEQNLLQNSFDQTNLNIHEAKIYSSLQLSSLRQKQIHRQLKIDNNEALKSNFMHGVSKTNINFVSRIGKYKVIDLHLLEQSKKIRNCKKKELANDLEINQIKNLRMKP